MKALTKIEHGSLDANGNNIVKTFLPGDTITKSGFSDDEWQALLDASAVSDSGEIPEGISGDRPWAATDEVPAEPAKPSK